MQILKSDDVMRFATKMVKYQMKIVFGNIKAVFFKVGTGNIHHKQGQVASIVSLLQSSFQKPKNILSWFSAI